MAERVGNTTRGKAIVEGCTFTRCAMPALLMEDDAAGWFESGPLHDLTIRNNTFIASGIELNPQVRSGELPVHENIRIENNLFLEGAGISAHHVKHLTITGNRSETGTIPIHLAKSCTDVTMLDNARKKGRGAPGTR